MNKSAIKNFAIWARNKLIADISYKAGLLGVTDKEIKPELPQSTKDAQFFDIGSQEPYRITGAAISQRKALADKITERSKQSDYVTAYKAVIEEVAYTWFNRLIAVRFMEVNDYLPSRVRVLSGTGGKLEPDIVTTPFDTDLEFSAVEREYIISCKTDNKLDELFRMLFIKQCNALNAQLPELFERIGDYTELLLNISFTDKDGVVWHLVNDIAEDDFKEAVEIIGWMYQYYNTEPKEETFALLKKNVKITKERIPAATQLFTPDWIVRYMVENSLGRLWLEGHPNDTLNVGWTYYLDEAEQLPEVQEQLEKMRVEYRGLSPEDITFIDPCMGSGHILVCAFDVFMQIYESAGYSRRDAARLILEKNIYGLDIDKRAYQLAYFALMMKARQYNRRILDEMVKPQVYFPNADIEGLEYGSLVRVDSDPELAVGVNVNFRALLARKYDVVCTNPPYMGSSGMNAKLAEFVKDKYSDSKSDLFAAFIERGLALIKTNGFNCMVTMQSWMFLSSFETMRKRILSTRTIINLMHMENMVMGIAFGTVVSNVLGVHVEGYKGRYNHVTMANIENDMPSRFPVGSKRDTSTSADDFAKIPGSPVAYWASNSVLHAYERGQTLSQIGETRQGMASSDDGRFVRLWQEIPYTRIGFSFESATTAKNSNYKWFPYNKGGSYRKWYGNNTHVVNYENDGAEVKAYAASLYVSASRTIKSTDVYFKKGLTWSAISSGDFSVRFFDVGFIISNAGMALYVKDDKKLFYLLGLLNSNLNVKVLMKVLNESINFNAGDISRLPVILADQEKTVSLINANYYISKNDWDSFETSWDFKTHPLIKFKIMAGFEGTNYSGTIDQAYRWWETNAARQFTKLKSNEEELNRIFIDTYGLQDELTPEVADKDVTVARIYDRKEDIPESMKGNGYVLTRADVIKSFISYAVGCMFGRYSLDVEGLVLAGENLLEKFTLYGTLEEENEKKPNGNLVVDFDKVYGLKGMGKASFQPDRDNILPITDEEYMTDDIVTRFVEFVRVVYGTGTLEENLRFIADALGNKGSTAREVIRNYLLRDFFKDHVKTYKKRPIYWLFDSGKADGFKALVYLHRYDQDTIGKLRIDYLHKLQRVYESEIVRMRETIEKSGDAREVSAAQKRLEKLIKQLKEAKDYDEKIAHLALARIALDLDDGVKVNYEKLQTGTDGKKYEVLGKI